MNMLSIVNAAASIEPDTWHLSGSDLVTRQMRLGDLSGIFKDVEAYKRRDPQTLVYTVQAYMPVAEGTPGGLHFGTTVIEPGRVGEEYFMTRGHSHAQANRGEYYWGVQGEGMLILMNREREVWAERIKPGSLHYIGAYTSHRVANTGSVRLIFGASWPSDAGHKYDEIARHGFAARLLAGSRGIPELIAEP